MISFSSSDPLRCHTRWIHLPDPEQIVTVLSVGLTPADRCSIRSIFQHSNWELCEAENYDEATSLVRTARIPVILCGVDPQGGSWRNLVEAARSLASLPTPRVILASSDADADLWSEALNLGAYDVLAQPFDAQEVIWVVSHAWLNWKGEAANFPKRRPQQRHEEDDAPQLKTASKAGR